MAKTNDKLPPVHPGEILSEDLMQPLGLTASELARELKIPATRLRDIVNGRRAIDTNVALRLARYFDSTAEFWLNLQAAYDLQIASALSARIAKEVHPRKAA